MILVALMATKKTAFITGASSGIGYETALKLAQDGYDLVVVARRLERIKELSQKISQMGKQVQALKLDVSNELELTNFFEINAEIVSKCTVLVNNAGLAIGNEKLHQTSSENINQMIDTNVKGLINVTKHILPAFIKNDCGHIVNIGSVAGKWVYPGGSVYCATKYAVRAISEALRMDLIGTKIRVTNIEPGMVETEFSVVRTGSREKADEVYKNMKPLKPQDIAETISWVISRPNHVNIQELVIFPTDQAAVGQVSRRS